MSSYLSNLLTHTTSKYNSLRRSLLSSEEDGDTDDDTHICRVLRAYYTEKGRPYPGWLPPDPHEKRIANAQPYGPPSGNLTSAGGRSQYGYIQNLNQPGQRGSLSDLWDPPAAQQNTGPMQPQSLRGARRPPAGPPPGASNLAPQARPLPSQRAGSYQSVASQQGTSGPGGRVSAEPSPPASSGGQAAGSAQERLKARLWGGGRGASPGGGSNQYDRPQVGTNTSWNSGGNPYDSGGRYGR